MSGALLPIETGFVRTDSISGRLKADINIFSLLDKRRYYLAVNSVTLFDAPPLNLAVQIKSNLVHSNSSVVYPHLGGFFPQLAQEPLPHLESLSVFKVASYVYKEPADYLVALKSYMLHEINQKENHIEFFLNLADYTTKVVTKALPENARWGISYSIYRL